MDADNPVIVAILSTLRGSENGRSMKIKELRKAVMMQSDIDKKVFKKTIQKLEADKRLSLSEEGICKLKKSEVRGRKEKSKKEKKDKKRKRNGDDSSDGDVQGKVQKKSENDHVHDSGDNKNEEQSQSVERNASCKGNPTGVTRLFVGNLPFAVDEASLRSFLEPAGEVTHIKWITDKETGRFYGSAFIEVANSHVAVAALNKCNGSEMMGRKIKLNLAPAREGDVWPPKSNVITGGQAQSKGVKSMSEKPEGCCKLFIGNLSYDIDDETIEKFFGAVDAEIKAVRWIHHKDSGDFKGVGFVEFWNTEACEKGATLNGKNLLGRPIRIDWTD